jgi:CelD/BcsL family acetyltransferase involved in cellulose biosynthesis
MAIRGELIDDPASLDRFVDQWDELAVAARRPYCSPGWMLTWWRHAAPKGAKLRVALALEDERLVGIAPLFAERSRAGLVRLRPLAAGTAARLGPVALAGREQEAAAALGAALAGARPAAGVIALDEVEPGWQWPELLGGAWPRGGASIERYGELPAPLVELDAGGFDEWLQSKSGNFRQQVRRGRRKLEGVGASWRVSTEGEQVRRDLEAFARLHSARWSGRGGSQALNAGTDRFLAEAAERLGGARFRVYSIDIEERPISAQVFVSAGDELSYWNGGFDESFAAHRPALQTLVWAIEDAFGRGERRMDLGAGAQDYKYRLATGEQKLEFARVVPPGRLNRLQLTPERARRVASERLTDQQKNRVRRVLRRSPAGEAGGGS